jgi:hypothetical protein
MKKKKERIFLMTAEQWVGLAILTLLIVGTTIGIKYLQPKTQPIIAIADSTKIQFEHYQIQQDSTYKAKWKKPTKHDTIAIRMHMFDPNTADSCTLVHLGFKPWQAKNMLKYRSKGGKYRKKEDLKKAVEGGNIEDIKAKMSALESSLHAMSEKLYQQAQAAQQQAQGGAQQQGPADDGVVDAEFKDVD